VVCVPIILWNAYRKHRILVRASVPPTSRRGDPLGTKVLREGSFLVLKGRID